MLSQTIGLFVHRLHDGAYNPGKDCATARTADRISKKAAKCPASSRIGTRSTTKERTKECASGDTTDRAANDLG